MGGEPGGVFGDGDGQAEDAGEVGGAGEEDFGAGWGVGGFGEG